MALWKFQIGYLHGCTKTESIVVPKLCRDLYSTTLIVSLCPRFQLPAHKIPSGGQIEDEPRLLQLLVAVSV